MKHRGNNCEYRDERDADLLRAYHSFIVSSKVIDIHKISEQVVSMPSSRFWISEERAAIVIRKIKKGDNLSNMRPLLREMFMEIFHRVTSMEKAHPELTFFDIIFHVVRQPAPKFYLTPESARVIMYKAKRRVLQDTKTRLKHMMYFSVRGNR